MSKTITIYLTDDLRRALGKYVHDVQSASSIPAAVKKAPVVAALLRQALEAEGYLDPAEPEAA